MRRSRSMGPDPDQDDDNTLGRLRARISRLLGGIGGDKSQQALPLSRYHGQSGPVVPYHERREQLFRSRRRQHSSYALVFIVILLVLVVLIFYGLNWALSGLSLGGGSRPTPTAAARGPAPLASPASPEPMAVLPTAAPGGTAPSPSPLPGAPPPPGAAPGPPGAAPGATSSTPERTYVVKPGDTLNQIARQFNVSSDALMRANNITNPAALRAGATLVIPPEATPTPPPTR
jgi:hypothetical protein